MNVYDSELVAGILHEDGHTIVHNEDSADVILVNTCTVRQSADQRALGILSQLAAKKREGRNIKIGLLGCLAERIGSDLEKSMKDLDFILGPDSYRILPSLLRNVPEHSFIPLENKVEDYDNILPLKNGGISAFTAISRGCDNHCSYCIIPSVRGGERSRPVESIFEEVKILVDKGNKEVTLLGQNVNSYKAGGVDFPGLLEKVSSISGLKRLRFTTSHPKDLSKKLVEVIRDRENVSSHIHLPMQSGSDAVLHSMGREYTSSHYMSLIELIKTEIPEVCITTDIISGFPGETDDNHNETLDLVKNAKFDAAFTFKYSPREGTSAYDLVDNIPSDVKTQRLNEVSKLQRVISEQKNKLYIGRDVEVMVENTSKRSSKDLLGKTEGNKNVVITEAEYIPGTMCKVKILAATSQTLIGSTVSLSDN